MNKTILFIASNPSHVHSLVPIYKEFENHKFNPLFITRDSFCEKEYQVENLLTYYSVNFERYEGFYFNSIEFVFSSISNYVKFKNNFFLYLDRYSFNLLFLCNDDSALFERVAIEYCSNNKLISCLVQESVRPFVRKISTLDKLRNQGVHQFLYDYMCKTSRCLNLSSYFRRGYGFSDCNFIFASGESYKKNLLLNNVDLNKIVVSGQPKFDHPVTKSFKNVEQNKTLLLCSQPVKCKQVVIDDFFVNFVHTVSLIKNVKLIVKLHPRDLDESYWINLIRSKHLALDIELTKNKNLNECFDQASAFVTIASTTCLEAMMRKIPVALINYLPINWYLPYDESAIVINDQKYLKESLENILFDHSLRLKLVNLSQKTVYEEFYEQDGKAAQRIFNFSLNLLNKRI